jgi:hypothetical protein
VYLAAWAFFKKRELKGIKPTPNKKAKKDDAANGGKDSVPSVDDVELEGEKDDQVLVYGKYSNAQKVSNQTDNNKTDTCDDVRKKINMHLKKPGVTQASFLRCVSTSYHTVPKKLTSSQLSLFRSKKGSYEGNTSGIFYGAYVYFEKLRIKEGKVKSKKREEMEKIHAERGGLDTKERKDHFLCLPGDSWQNDAYGRHVLNGGIWIVKGLGCVSSELAVPLSLSMDVFVAIIHFRRWPFGREIVEGPVRTKIEDMRSH